jgi:hypothetical protein
VRAGIAGIGRLGGAVVGAGFAGLTITEDRHALVGVPIAAGGAVGDTLLAVGAFLGEGVAEIDDGPSKRGTYADHGGRMKPDTERVTRALSAS